MKIDSSLAANSVTVRPAVVPMRGGNQALWRFGVGEIINLAVTGVSNAISSNSAWSLVSGAASGLTVGADKLMATFRCPDVPKYSRGVEVVIRYGTAVEIRFDVIPPNTGKTKVESPIHKVPRGANNKPNAGYFGHMIVGPADVSFMNIEIQEGGGTNRATGVLGDFDGNEHEHGNGWASPSEVTNEGTVFAWDEVFTPANGVPEGGWSGDAANEVVGTSETPIEWLYRLRNSADAGKLFAKVKHIATVTKSGKMTISKGDTVITTEMADAGTYNHPFGQAFDQRRYL